jgi:hypothetical protein
MKFNWKILIPSVLIIIALFWMVDSLRVRSYSGGELSFGVGSGAITVSNPSDNPVPIQLMGTGTHTFSVASAVAGLSGSSARQGNGSDSTQLLEFSAPPGISVLTIVHGSDVRFVEQENTPISVMAQPLSSGEASTTLLLGGIVVLGGLFYLSRTTGHQWMNRFRRQESADQTATKLAERLAFKQRFDRTTSDKP